MSEAEDRGKNLIGSVGDVGTIQRYKNIGYEKKIFFGGYSECLKFLVWVSYRGKMKGGQIVMIFGGVVGGNVGIW